MKELTNLDKSSEEIKALWNEVCLDVKSKMLRIGKILFEAHTNGDYKAKYGTFRDYLDGENFPFSRRHASRLMDKHNCYINGTSSHGMKLISELTYVPDSDIREKITKAKPIEIKDFSSKVKREAQRFNPNVTDGDSPECKCQRQLKTILAEISDFDDIRSGLDYKITEVSKSALNFPSNEIIRGLMNDINAKWRKNEISR